MSNAEKRGPGRPRIGLEKATAYMNTRLTPSEMASVKKHAAAKCLEVTSLIRAWIAAGCPVASV